MTKHTPYTPAPWMHHEKEPGEFAVNAYYLDGTCGPQIASVFSEADARLISAAPEMFDLCQLMFDVYRGHEIVTGLARSKPEQLAMEKWGAVIEKATGVNPCAADSSSLSEPPAIKAASVHLKLECKECKK